MNGSATWFISIADMHTGIDALFLQRILQGQRVDDGGEHAHVVRGDAVHVLGLLGDAAEKIPAADDDGELNAELVHIRDFGGDLVNARSNPRRNPGPPPAPRRKA